MFHWLVVRREALRIGNSKPKIHNSDYWPMVISSEEWLDSGEVLRKALDNVTPGYSPGYEYLVVPMREALLVSLRVPKPQYEVVTRGWGE